MRLATDFQTALILATVIWVLWYWVPVLLDAIFDPHADDFEDITELLEHDR